MISNRDSNRFESLLKSNSSFTNYHLIRFFEIYQNYEVVLNSNLISLIRDPPALSDWQYADGVLRAVTVGQRDPEPEIPPYTEWIIDGNPPPSVVLLAGIFYKIRGKDFQKI